MAKSKKSLLKFRAPDGVAAEDRDAIGTFNQCIARMKVREKTEIKIAGELRKSKLAWKIATYQQPVLYRTVMLAEGVCINWNADNVLCCLLSARALIETCALVLEFEFELSRLLEKSDVEAADGLLMNRMFATRDEQINSDIPESRAINVQTFIDKLDKRLLPGIRDRYNDLSERCHPNSFGHHQLFGRRDRRTGTTKYFASGKRSQFLVPILCLPPVLRLTENSLLRLDGSISRAAEIQPEDCPLNWGDQPLGIID